MTSERWQRVKLLFQAAVERPADERATFLGHAAEDDDVRREVESLLAAETVAVDLLDRPSRAGAEAAATRMSPPSGPARSAPLLSAGHRIGGYEVVSLLGLGGMGEVYRTRDTKLNREVALKVLPAAFAADPNRLARFKREAHVLASLNHPNIAAIYGVEETAGLDALVLELAEGPTLAARVQKGPMAIDEVVSIARQIADALESAHDQGIIHRDLKPSNVKLRPDGVVKVLDFGLAKALAPEPAADGPADAPALFSAADTRDGVLIGTAAYMAPEQARGEPVDRRADIWAFGCVLFEMLSGQAPFRGQTVTAVLVEVIDSDPDWTLIPRGTPPGVGKLVRRCLTKNPRQRLQAIGDARIELDEIDAAAAVDDDRSDVRAGWRERAAWLAAGVATLVALGALRQDGSVENRVESRLDITTAASTDPASLALSPDGQKVIFSAPNADGWPQLWIRYLNDVSAHPLPGTESGRYPFWSPDNRSIGFFATGRLKRLDLDGLSLRDIADAPLGLGGTWNRAGTIVFSPNWVGPLVRVSASGGRPVDVTRMTSQQSGHRLPQFLPDGRRFLFESIESGGIAGVIYAGDVDGGDAVRLVDAGSGATYAPPGYLLFGRGGPAIPRLVAQRFDPERLALSGEPFPIAEAMTAGLDPGSGAVSVAATGLIAYRADSNAGQRQFVWFDRSGKELAALGSPEAATSLNPVLSPDGRQVAVRRSLGENTDIWLLDSRTGLYTRLTSTSGLHNFPVWSPDGRSIAFSANVNRAGLNDLYRKAIDGSETEELLLATAQNKGLSDWSPDGRYLVFRSVDAQSGNDIWALSIADRTTFPVVQTSFDERDAQFSPDGRWIAYQANDTGAFEIWARPFPGPGPPVRISTNGGTQVRWRRDGKELFYIAMNGQLMAVPIQLGKGGQTLEPGGPVALFAARVGGALQGQNRAQYMVAPDGHRFLMNTVLSAATSTITVITNWNGGR
jgi:serine/threonine protein kinase